MATKGKTTKIIRSAAKEARRDIAQVSKTAAAASRAIKATAKVFVKPSPARELAQTNKLLGTEYTSLRSARKALKEQSSLGRRIPGYTLPAGVVIKRPAAARPTAVQPAAGPGKGKPLPAAAPPAPAPVLPMEKIPGRPGHSVFRTRQLPGGITQDDVERGLMELSDEGLARKMDALLKPGEQWCFVIQNPQTGFFFRSKMLYGSWSSMVRDLRKNYGDLGPNAMQALTFMKVSSRTAPQRKLTDEEYESLVSRHKTATQEAREKYQAWRKEQFGIYKQELAKRGLPIPTTMAETIKSFGQVFEREERMKAAAAAERKREQREARNQRDRDRRARARAEKAAAEFRKQAGIEKRRATMAAKREAAAKAARAAERKRAAAERKRAAAERERSMKREVGYKREIEKLKQQLKAAQAKAGGRRKGKRK